MAVRKKLGVHTVGFLLAAMLIMGEFPGGRSLAQSATPWKLHAIEGAFAGVRVREIDASNAAVIFLYDLDNKTDSDYQLTKGLSLVIMSRLKSSGSLSSEKPVVLSSSAFLPAGNRTRIALEIKQSFPWPGRIDAKAEDKIRRLVYEEVADITGFVLFDESARCQISLPGGWPEVPDGSAGN